MKMNLSIKDLLILLDVILFAHVRFHKDEFSALVGTSDESRKELREKIVETLIDALSDNSEKEIKLTDTDVVNLEGYMNNFQSIKNTRNRIDLKGRILKDLKRLGLK